MDTTLLFWKDWEKQHKYIYYIFLSLFFACIILFVSSTQVGFDNATEWKTNINSHDINVPTHKFSRKLIDYELQSQGYFVDQHFRVEIKAIPSTVYTIYLVVLALASALALTALSMVKQSLWHLSGLAVFLAWIYFLRIDLHEIAGLGNNTIMLSIMAIFTAVSFLFNAYLTTTSAWLRLLVFLILTLGTGYFLLTTSNMHSPAIAYSGYSIWIPWCVTILFIGLIAYDFLSAFLTLVSLSRSSNPKINVLNFVALSVIYLGNLTIYYFNKKGTIDWELSYFNPLYFFIFSAILGIWGHKRRSSLFSKILPFAPVGAYLYLSLAITGFITLYFVYQTGNTSMLRAINDIILYSHLCFGLAFFVYVLFNFLPEFLKNLPIYKILYTPQHLPYYVARLSAVIFVIMLMAEDNWQQYYKSKSGYYNYLADVYHVNEEELLKKDYCQRSNAMDRGNQKAAFYLAKLAEKEQDYAKVVEHLEDIVSKDPSPQTYVNLANAQRLHSPNFYDLFTLKKGYELFPESYQLNHNIAHSFIRLNQLDSSYIYYASAWELSEGNPVTGADLFYIHALSQVDLGLDSMITANLFQNDVHYQINKQQVNSYFGKKHQLPFNEQLLSDSILNQDDIFYLNNYLFSQREETDRSFENLLKQFIHPGNDLYFEDIYYLMANYYFIHGNSQQMKLALDNMLINAPSSSHAYYGNMAGYMMYESDAPLIAMNYFKTSYDAQPIMKSNHAAFDYCLLNAEYGFSDKSLELLDEIEVTDTSISDLALEMKGLLNTDKIDTVVNWNEDYLKVKYIYYSPRATNVTDIKRILASVKNPNYKGMIVNHLIEGYLQQGDLELANEMWNVMLTENVHPLMYERLQFSYMNLLIAQREFLELNGRSDTLRAAHIGAQKLKYKPYFKAVSLEAMGRLDEARGFYEKALEQTPFHTGTILSAANFFAKNDAEKERAYNILTNATRDSPNDPYLLQAYILEATRKGYIEFAKSALESLPELITKEEFEAFYPKFQRTFEKQQQEDEAWENF